ncbi:MAG: DUF2322 family protein [Gammaproteobacteria bacterium]
MSNEKTFGAGFDDLADTSHLKNITFINRDTDQSFSLENIPGKQASVKILYSIAQTNHSQINRSVARTGIALFGDYAQEEEQQPNSHPNIRFLMNIMTNDEEWLVNAE